MEEAKKMVALKKAYADIILNTAKEAAARIMVSERQALRFQQDLCSTKDEALRMLLRLKQMIGAKITEAEITSLSQRGRIEELESQLNEAEGIILDLREELKQVQDQLDEVKNNHVQPLNGPFEKEDVPCHENTVHLKQLTDSEAFISSTSDSRPKVVTTPEVQTSPMKQGILDNKCCNSAKQSAMSNSHFDNFFVGNPDFTSMIMKSKEPELYRNGCTQRIRAIERNLRDEKIPSSGIVDDQHFFVKSESVISGNGQNLETCIVPSPKTENMDIMNPAGFEKVLQINGSTTEDQPVIVRKMRRRKTRYGKAKASSCMLRCGHPLKPHQQSLAFSHCKKISSTENDNVNSGDGVCTLHSTKAENLNTVENSFGLEKKLQHNKDEAVCIIRRSLRKRKFKYHDDIVTSCRSLPDHFTEPCQPCLFLSRCKTYPVNCNLKSGEDQLKTESEEKIKTIVDPISAFANVTVCKEVDRESKLTKNATDEYTELMDDSVLVKQDGDAAESPGVSSCKLNIEMDNVPLMDSDSRDAKTSEATDGVRSQADNNRFLKYTFSRKRKKESLTNPDENSSLGKSTMKRKVGEKQNIAPELQNSSVINESSGDSRQLVQVARQLISLSGKRWG